jgi:hypothetical protein
MLLIDRLSRRRKRLVSKSANGDRQSALHALWLPINRAAATWAEVEGDWVATIGGTSERSFLSNDRHVVTTEKGGDAVGAARAPLAIQAVT